MIRLSSGNYREVEFAHTAALSAGTFVAAATLGGSLNAFVGFKDLAANELGAFVVFAERAKATKVAADALAFAPGEKVHYNVAGAKVSKTAADPLIGYAKRAAAAADTVVDIECDGSKALSEAVTLADITDLADLEIASDQITDLSTTLGALTFAGLADVDVAGVTNNDTLKFDAASGKWVDVAAAD